MSIEGLYPTKNMAANEIKPFGKRDKTKEMEATLSIFRGETLANCKKYSADWWKVVSKWLKQKEDNEYKKLAVVEFNKLQI